MAKAVICDSFQESTLVLHGNERAFAWPMLDHIWTIFSDGTGTIFGPYLAAVKTSTLFRSFDQRRSAL